LKAEQISSDLELKRDKVALQLEDLKAKKLEAMNGITSQKAILSSKLSDVKDTIRLGIRANSKHRESQIQIASTQQLIAKAQHVLKSN
jgi:hypothetical protein